MYLRLNNCIAFPLISFSCKIDIHFVLLSSVVCGRSVVVAVSFEVLTVGDRKGKGRENQIILRAAFSSLA
jgi:hypothetical protein